MLKDQKIDHWKYIDGVYVNEDAIRRGYSLDLWGYVLGCVFIIFSFLVGLMISEYMGGI